MAVIKLTKSGKGLLFVDDQGNVFSTSKAFAAGILEGKFKYPLLLTRLRVKIPEGKFKVSPLLDENWQRVPAADIAAMSDKGLMGNNNYAKLKEEFRDIGDLDEW